jgi:hypothetical protein
MQGARSRCNGSVLVHHSQILECNRSGESAMSARTRRRWYQFSLRTMLIVLAVVAAPAAWVAKERRQSKYEEQIAEKLLSLGAFDATLGGPYDLDDLHRRNKPQGRWSNLAQRALGNRILSIGVKPLAFTDHSLMAGLSNLQTLYLAGSQDTDLTPLVGLKKLKILSLDASAVTDLSPLRELTGLRELMLDGTKVTDFTPLSSLRQLVGLRLYSTGIRDLTPLEDLSRLYHLNLRDTPTDDLTPLAGLQNLRILDVSYTQLKDLTPLYDLTQLQKVDVQKTPVTQEQIEALQKALPKCRIDHDPFP